jgi:aminoglycoside phosphotransferase (APT) family kinase protein
VAGIGPRSGLSEDDALAVASVVLPEVRQGKVAVERGGEHTVVVAPDVGAVRIATGDQSAALMPRRTELLAELSALNLPFAVPVPLSEVVNIGRYTAVATSWVPGAPHPKGEGSPAALAQTLAALRSVDVWALEGLLAAPHGYAGGARWAELMADAVACLPADVRADAQGRLDDALALPEVEPSLVHADLAGHNMRWSDDRRLIGIIDWDWAAAWDPAIDAACLAWHGWATVKAAVDAKTYQRARVWQRTFGIEQIVASWLRPPGPADVVRRTAEWLRRTRDKS